MTISTTCFRVTGQKSTPFARVVASGSVIRIRRFILGATTVFNNTGPIAVTDNSTSVYFTPADDAGTGAQSQGFNPVDPQGPVQAHTLEYGWTTAPSWSQPSVYLMAYTAWAPIDIQFSREEAPVIYPSSFGMLLINGTGFSSGNGPVFTLVIEED